MRISEKESMERQKYMLELFIKNPQLSIPKANAAMQKRFKAAMNAQKAYAIREQARQKVLAKEEKGAAARHQGKKAPKLQVASRHQPATVVPVTTSGRNQLAIIEGSGENMEFFRSAIEALRAAGLADLKIDHQTNNYAVVRA